jgi:hypothetical protein
MSYQPNSTPAKSISANYTMSIWDMVLIVDASAASVTITLPTKTGLPANILEGFRCNIRVGTIVFLGNVTVNTTDGSTIDGSATLVITTSNSATEIIYSGGNWHQIG